MMRFNTRTRAADGELDISPSPTLQFRLEELLAKIDALVEAVIVSETAADAHWQQLGTSGLAISTSERAATDVAELNSTDQSSQLVGAQFAALLASRDALAAKFQASERKGNWTVEQEERAERQLNPLSAKLFALAQELALIPADNSSALRFKALAIKEFVEEKSDDVVHNLALSLADDILAQKL